MSVAAVTLLDEFELLDRHHHLAGLRTLAGAHHAALLEQVVAPSLRAKNPERRREGLEDLQQLAEIAQELSSLLLGRDLGPGVGRPILDEIERTAPGLVIALRRSMRDHEPITRSEGVLFRAEAPVPLGVTTTTVADDAGGCIELEPTIEYSVRRRYRARTNVLETTFTTASGSAKVKRSISLQETHQSA